MRIDLKALGSKLSAYRQQMGESIADLVTATGIDSTRLSGIETGVIWPTGDEVLIIADHYRLYGCLHVCKMILMSGMLRSGCCLISGL
ncbi:MAG: helix-turn-helix domain-containing protein [Acidithiobacillus sp.]